MTSGSDEGNKTNQLFLCSGLLFGGTEVQKMFGEEGRRGVSDKCLLIKLIRRKRCQGHRNDNIADVCIILHYNVYYFHFTLQELC